LLLITILTVENNDIMGLRIGSFIAIMLSLFLFVEHHVMAFENSDFPERPRLLVLTDIGGDPDDTQSLRRLLVYANEFRIEGLIATSTMRRALYGLTRFTAENIIFEAIDDYEQVRDNLALHAEGYPTANELRAVVRAGNPDPPSADHIVPGQSSPGSQHIISVVDSSDEPLCIAVWGEVNELAQALLNVKSTRSPKDVEKFASKIRVYAINDQDMKRYPNGSGEWIKKNFPYIKYVESGAPRLMPIITGAYRGVFQNDAAGGGHPTLPLVKPGKEFNQEEWVATNILAWGPLGAGYPAEVNLNPNTARNTRGSKEGDTPSMFFFLPHGLNNPNHPEWGSWGGRFQHHNGGHYIDAQDNHWSGEMDGSLRRKWTVARWREAYQNDFAARMRWCVLGYEEANHNPVAVIGNDKSRNVIVREVKNGETVSLDASASYDPDGDNISFKWWIYHEPSSLSSVALRNSDKAIAHLEIPESPLAGDVHVILEVSDEGEPKLTSFRRVVLRVMDENTTRRLSGN
jgi:hypothetical protein